jgi:hypothetical protein
MKFVFIFMVLMPLLAGAETLIVSINHVVPPTDVQAYVDRLNRRDASMGTQYFQATVTQYIPYDQTDLNTPYYGVALVELDDHGSPSGKRAYLQWLDQEQAAGVYTNYANPNIGLACGTALTSQPTSKD